MTLQLLGLAGAGYLLGSIPTAWIITRLVTGEDLRELGSGNIGVMNTAISVTRWAGLIVFVGEIAKGMGAVLLARALVGPEETIGLAGLTLSAQQVAISVTVLMTVIGTRRMIWLGFRGGRGTTSGLSALALISFPAFLVTSAIWIGSRYLIGDSFWATRINLLTRPFVLGWFTQSWVYLVFGIALSGAYLTTHEPETDDHAIIKEQWSNIWGFLFGPKRRER